MVSPLRQPVPRRPYQSPVRRRQAEETRRRVLEGAQKLLLSSGYAASTIEAIASAAAVSPKTVAAIFRSKRGILAALLDPVAFESRFQQSIEQLRAEVEPRQRVRLAARLARDIYGAMNAEFELMRSAGGVAADLGDHVALLERRRRENLERLVQYVAEHAGLGSVLSREETTDVLLVLTSYDGYRTLVLRLGWTPDRYESWLGDLMTATVFGETPLVR